MLPGSPGGMFTQRKTTRSLVAKFESRPITSAAAPVVCRWALRLTRWSRAKQRRLSALGRMAFLRLLKWAVHSPAPALMVRTHREVAILGPFLHGVLLPTAFAVERPTLIIPRQATCWRSTHAGWSAM